MIGKTGVLPAMLLVVLLGGCAVPATPSYDASFGDAVRQARAVQVLDPSAGQNANPVTGVDGQAGKAAIDRYQESFRTPPRSFEVFDIGGQLQGQ